MSTRPEVKKKTAAKAKDAATASITASINNKLGVMKSSQTALEDIEEDERNAGLLFDEAQFGK